MNAVSLSSCTRLKVLFSFASRVKGTVGGQAPAIYIMHIPFSTCLSLPLSPSPFLSLIVYPPRLFLSLCSLCLLQRFLPSILSLLIPHSYFIFPSILTIFCYSFLHFLPVSAFPILSLLFYLLVLFFLHFLSLSLFLLLVLFPLIYFCYLFFHIFFSCFLFLCLSFSSICCPFKFSFRSRCS